MFHTTLETGKNILVEEPRALSSHGVTSVGSEGSSVIDVLVIDCPRQSLVQHSLDTAFQIPVAPSNALVSQIEHFARCILPIVLLVMVTLTPVHATTQPSIPINGRYSVFTVKIYIPLTPKWAHDVVLNATIAWNRAQLHYLQNNSTATAYNFVETDDGTATSTVSFSMSTAYASIAVGWTNYIFAPGTRNSIISTQTYLTPTVFNDAQANNATANRYAFWLALHELGRTLGLGSLMDGKDIMEPRYFAPRLDDVPQFSTLDLYALHVLGQGSAPNFVTLPDGVENQFTPATFFLPNPHSPVPLAPTAAVTQSTAGSVNFSAHCCASKLTGLHRLSGVPHVLRVPVPSLQLQTLRV